MERVPIYQLTKLQIHQLEVSLQSKSEPPERSITKPRQRRVERSDFVIQEFAAHRRAAIDEVVEAAAEVEAGLRVRAIQCVIEVSVEAIKTDTARHERVNRAAFPVVNGVASGKERRD